MNESGGPKRTPEQRERDLAILSELYLKGIPEFDMAEIISGQYEFSLSTRTIRNDKAELRKRWIESQIINFDEAKARELELIDKAIAACWVGWENSLRDEGYTSEETYEGDKLAGGESTEPIRLTSYKKIERQALRDGNIVWIEEIRKLSDQRAKILGLYEAEKFQIDWRDRLIQSGMDKVAIDRTLEEAMKVVDVAFGNDEITE
jgi:hypothetical protein